MPKILGKNISWFDTAPTYNSSKGAYSDLKTRATIQPGYNPRQKGALSILGETMQGVAAPFGAAYGNDFGIQQMKLRQQQEEADAEFQKFLIGQKNKYTPQDIAEQKAKTEYYKAMAGAYAGNPNLVPQADTTGDPMEGYGMQLSGIRSGKPQYTADTPAEIFQRSSKLREEFINRPEVKDYVATNTSVRSMDSLLKTALSGGKKDKVALDQGLITLYNKLTDPNSVVRESEYARTPENIPTINRISGAVQKLQAGGAGLTDEDRKALVIGAKIIGDERGRTFNEAYDAYNSLAGEAKVKPTKVLRDFKRHENYLSQKPSEGTFSTQDIFKGLK